MPAERFPHSVPDRMIASTAAVAAVPADAGRSCLARRVGLGRAGYTLIEVLVTMMLLAALVAIGITNLSTTIDKTSETAAVADLRNAMSAQEAYRVDHDAYAQLVELPISTTEGVTIAGAASAGGYRMTARHARSPSVYSVTVGDGASTEGAILRD